RLPAVLPSLPTRRSSDLLVVEGVGRDTLAARLGLRDGDVLLEVDGMPLTSEAELLEVVTLAYEAEALSVRVRRDDRVLTWASHRDRKSTRLHSSHVKLSY